MKHEDLSALLDGELDELATMRLLRELQEEGDAASSAPLQDWQDWSLIGDALREGQHLSTTGSLGARRALAQLAGEPAPARPASVTRVAAGLAPRRWFGRAGRQWMPWAVAASAALVAFQLASLPLGDQSVTASARMAAGRALAMAGLGEPPAQQADPADVERLLDLHDEVAHGGFQRTSLEASVGSVHGQ